MDIASEITPTLDEAMRSGDRGMVQVYFPNAVDQDVLTHLRSICEPLAEELGLEIAANRWQRTDTWVVKWNPKKTLVERADDDDLIEFGARRTIPEGDSSVRMIKSMLHEVVESLTQQVHFAKTADFTITMEKVTKEEFGVDGYTVLGKAHARAKDLR